MLKRKTPLRRTGGLKRSPMKRRNPERAAKRREEAFGKQAELCRQMPCVVCWEPYKSLGKAVCDLGIQVADAEMQLESCAEELEVARRLYEGEAAKTALEWGVEGTCPPWRARSEWVAMYRKAKGMDA